VARPAHPKRDPEVAVLVVDAIPNLVERRTTTLEGHGFQDYTAADGPAALDRASAAPPDVSPVLRSHRRVRGRNQRSASLKGCAELSVPVLGPMTSAGFAHGWYFLFLLVILGLVGSYAVLQIARQRRVLRFANLELLESVAPTRPTRWGYLPAILLVAALLALTVAMAGPTDDVRIPRNRAVVMLVIDVSQSMRATDVPPTRMAAAQDAAKQFADDLTPGINLGLIAYGGTATVLVEPTTNRGAIKAAIDKLQFQDRTATGEAIFTALQAIATVGAVIGGGDTPPPARIVLFSDGMETVPSNPDNPKGAYTAARTAKDQGVPISTISFGTPYDYVEINGQRQPVPVDDETMKKVTALSGGTAYKASTITELKDIYATLQQQIGYETIKGDASAGWLRLGTLMLTLTMLAGLAINRRLPS